MAKAFVLILLASALLILGRALFKYAQFKEKKLINKFKVMTPEQRQFEMVRLQANLSNHKTSHLLHFVLSVFTCGAWVIPWLLIDQHNTSYKRKYNYLMKTMVKAAA